MRWARAATTLVFAVERSAGVGITRDGGGQRLKEYGEPRRNRTFNPQIKSLLLCQLS